MMPPHTAIEKLEIHQCTQDITLPALQPKLIKQQCFRVQGSSGFGPGKRTTHGITP